MHRTAFAHLRVFAILFVLWIDVSFAFHGNGKSTRLGDEAMTGYSFIAVAIAPSATMATSASTARSTSSRVL